MERPEKSNEQIARGCFDGEVFITKEYERILEALNQKDAALEVKAAEAKELHEAYMRIRELVEAWDTKPGGVDRFEVTESKIKALKQEVEIWKANCQAETPLETSLKKRIDVLEAMERQVMDLSHPNFRELTQERDTEVKRARIAEKRVEELEAENNHLSHARKELDYAWELANDALAQEPPSQDRVGG